MWYISTAKHLERTAPWLENLPGGVTYLKKVICEDSLGICAGLDKIFETNHAKWHCEWREVAYDEDATKRFRQFMNTDAHKDDNEQIEYVDMRKQRHPNTYALPDITGPAAFVKESAPAEGSPEAEGWSWIFGGKADEYTRNLGYAILHGTNELAVFFARAAGEQTGGQWFCTQNLSPNKQSMTISRGLIGQLVSGVITLAEPIYKATYDLNTGKGLANPALNISTFHIRETNDGDVLVWAPPADVMAAAFLKQAQAANEAAGFVHPGPCKDGVNPLPTKKVDPLDW
jgi:nitrite reductase (NAD(P)H)